MSDDLVVRPATPGDRRDILALFERALGWTNDARHEALFAWKHDQNVFGASSAWVARRGDDLTGFRTFLRWEFAAGGETVRAVRAVDTVTDPQYQRRGVFRALTLGALERLKSDGARFVFNTPNSQSRPGYLKMGWQVVGRVPLAARPGGLRGMARMSGARVPADLWSVETAGGDPAAAVLHDSRSVSELLASQPRTEALVTRRSAEYLRWRYGFAPLQYRAIAIDDDAAHGLAIFRVRQRGTARETALCEVLVPGDDRRSGRRLVHQVARAVGTDYVLRVARRDDACLPLPRLGPFLTCRPLGHDAPPARDWDLTLGDVELL